MRQLISVVIIILLSISIYFLVDSLPKSNSTTGKSNEVVVYTALDKIFSEPLLQKFEKETGIKVKAVSVWQ